jgi:hypothetical protein
VGIDSSQTTVVDRLLYKHLVLRISIGLKICFFWRQGSSQRVCRLHTSYLHIAIIIIIIIITITYSLRRSGHLLSAGVTLKSPKGDELSYVLQIQFPTTNNIIEYEMLPHGLCVKKVITIKNSMCCGDSDLVS